MFLKVKNQFSVFNFFAQQNTNKMNNDNHDNRSSSASIFSIEYEWEDFAPLEDPMSNTYNNISPEKLKGLFANEKKKYWKTVMHIDHIDNIYSPFVSSLIYNYVDEILFLNEFEDIKSFIFGINIPPTLKCILWNHVFINAVKEENDLLFQSILKNHLIEIDKNMASFIFETGTIHMVTFMLENERFIGQCHFYEKYFSISKTIHKSYNYNPIVELTIPVYQKYSKFIKKWIKNGISFDKMLGKVHNILFGNEYHEQEKFYTCSINYQILFKAIYNNDTNYNILHNKDYDSFKKTITSTKLQLYEKYILYKTFEFIFIVTECNMDDVVTFYRSINHLFKNKKEVIEHVIKNYIDFIIHGFCDLDMLYYLTQNKTKELEVYTNKYIEGIIYYMMEDSDSSYIRFENFLHAMETLLQSFALEDESVFSKFEWIIYSIFKNRVSAYFYLNCLDLKDDKNQWKQCHKFIDPKCILNYNLQIISKIIYIKLVNEEYNFIIECIRHGLSIKFLLPYNLKIWPFDKINLSHDLNSFFTQGEFTFIYHENLIHYYFEHGYENKVDTHTIIDRLFRDFRRIKNIINFTNSMILKCIKEDKQMLLLEYLVNVCCTKENGNLVHCTIEEKTEIIKKIESDPTIKYMKLLLENVDKNYHFD